MSPGRLARLGALGRRGPDLPAELRAALGERAADVLSRAHDVRSGADVVATKTHVYAVLSGSVVLDRPWHMVDTGSWDNETSRLTVHWVDRSPATVWELEELGSFPQVLRERVQASVVLADEVDLGSLTVAGPVVGYLLAGDRLQSPLDELRRWLTANNVAVMSVLLLVIGVTILGKGVRSSDPGVREETSAASQRLREQVGLD